MIKYLFIPILFLVLSLQVNSQIVFKKGYIIKNNDDKLSCAIKDMGWKSCPISITYKLSSSDEEYIANIDSIKEFEISGISKYVRFKGDVDRSTETMKDISWIRNPVYEKETIFLKTLVEGKACLYAYTDRNLTKYFFNNDTTEIKQLIYKKYYTTHQTVTKNEYYKQQLSLALSNSCLKSSAILNVRYGHQELIKLFKAYNQCFGKLVDKDLGKRLAIDVFNINLRPGIYSSSLELANPRSIFSDLNFDQKVQFRMGLELEYILPFYSNKLAVMIEPTYQSYKSSVNTVISSHNSVVNTTNVYVDYKSMELPIGLRYYMFLSPNSKLFVSVNKIFDAPIRSKISSDRVDLFNFKVRSQNNFAIGCGYKYRDKFGVEYRYGFRRDIIRDYLLWRGDYKCSSIIVSYTLF